MLSGIVHVSVRGHNCGKPSDHNCGKHLVMNIRTSRHGLLAEVPTLGYQDFL